MQEKESGQKLAIMVEGFLKFLGHEKKLPSPKLNMPKQFNVARFWGLVKWILVKKHNPTEVIEKMWQIG